jgi:hypothetical protein
MPLPLALAALLAVGDVVCEALPVLLADAASVPMPLPLALAALLAVHDVECEALSVLLADAASVVVLNTLAITLVLPVGVPVGMAEATCFVVFVLAAVAEAGVAEALT